MQNPYFKNQLEAAFDTAAGEVDAYLQANSDREEIPNAEIAGACPTVQQIIAFAGGTLPEGYKEELLQRIKKLSGGAV